MTRQTGTGSVETGTRSGRREHYQADRDIKNEGRGVYTHSFFTGPLILRDS